MSNNYTNLPSKIQNNNVGQRAFVNFYVDPIEIDAATLNAITGFFTSRGFEPAAAASFASVLIAQSKKENLNPLNLLDTLKGYENVQLNSLIAEVVNFNRFKTSFLGFGPIFTSNSNVTRNILP